MEKILDIIWLIQHLLYKKPFKWQDAKSCGQKYCSYCGGDWFNHETDFKN